VNCESGTSALRSVIPSSPAEPRAGANVLESEAVEISFFITSKVRFYLFKGELL
jgi:hypothetical protein